MIYKIIYKVIDVLFGWIFELVILEDNKKDLKRSIFDTSSLEYKTEMFFVYFKLIYKISFHKNEIIVRHRV